MSNLKELTWEHHKNAERQKFVKELMGGKITNERYATYLFNQHPQYDILEAMAYRSFDGGDTIQKLQLVNNAWTVSAELKKNDDNDNKDEWEIEKISLSKNYPHLGVYNPLPATTEAINSWHNENPDWTEAFPSFGTYNGEYLDRLQRPRSLQTGNDMHTVIRCEDLKIQIEKDEEGNFYQRPWCEDSNEFYNVQPCCVFPENPGRTKLTEDEAQILISQYNNWCDSQTN